MVLIGPGTQVGADFAGEFHPAQGADAGQQRGVAASRQGQEFAVQVGDLRRVVSHYFDFLPGLGRLRRALRVERAQERFDLRIARRDLRLVKTVGFERLAQREEVMLLPVALQAREHFGFFLVEHLRLAQRGEHRGVALAGEDGLDDAQPADPVELAQDVVEAHPFGFAQGRLFIRSSARCICRRCAPAIER